jgi:hypothetical protein
MRAMDKLSILRERSQDYGTFGRAFFMGSSWPSLELPWRDNQPERSCVPAGIYEAHLKASKKFGYQVYELQRVPQRSAVEIHIANFAGDIDLGLRSDLEGCVCLGTSKGQLMNHQNVLQDCVRGSGVAFHQFMALTMLAPKILVEITWADGADPAVTP